jgi:hypothetical protein
MREKKQHHINRIVCKQYSKNIYRGQRTILLSVLLNQKQKKLKLKASPLKLSRQHSIYESKLTKHQAKNYNIFFTTKKLSANGDIQIKEKFPREKSEASFGFCAQRYECAAHSLAGQTV